MAIDQETRFEHAVFRVALGIALVLVAVRVAFAIVMWYLHHSR